jgi:hypothetical protein
MVTAWGLMEDGYEYQNNKFLFEISLIFAVGRCKS